MSTIDKVKPALTSLLGKNEQRVIVLRGKWGTGKTYLWRKIDEEFSSSAIKPSRSVYVSLFGTKSVSELKLRILKSAYNKGENAAKKAFNSTVSGVAAAFKNITGASVEDIALTWLPDLLKGRLVVIDDIERKHVDLDVDEFLALINEYAENYEVRFLLLLNSDKLAKSTEMWEILHEKVIDAELVLSPSPAEAFAIACSEINSPILAHVKKSAGTLDITNIRVLRKIIRVVERITNCSPFSESAPDRWIPSAVLLTASHYRCLDDAPSYDYLRSKSGPWEHFLPAEKKEANPQEEKWNAILQDLGISSSDKFEEILNAYLQTGILDEKSIENIFSEYHLAIQKSGATDKRNSFLNSFWWDQNSSNDDLLKQAEDLLPFAESMLPGHISDVVQAINQLGGQPLAIDFLNKWTAAADQHPALQDLEQRDTDDDPRLHPLVLAKLNQIYSRKYPPISVIDAIERILDDSSWGEREEAALNRATVKDYEEALRSITGKSLSRFVTGHIRKIMTVQGSLSLEHAGKTFVAACRKIVQEDSDSRMAWILVSSFKRHGLPNSLSVNEARHANGA